MARRRLSDLLREEANKPSDDSTAAAGVESSADEPDAEHLDVAGEATIASVSTKASTAAKNASAKRTTATEPQETHTHEQDEALLQQIADLTSALDAQKVMVEKLQTELEQMHTLKTELEQTRKDMRELSDTNAKLTKELKTLQTPKATETRTPTAAKSRAPQELKLAPAPVEASGHPVNSFNRDVGWFD